MTTTTRTEMLRAYDALDDDDEKEQWLAANNAALHSLFTARANVLNRRHIKLGSNKKAATHQTAAAMFAACGTYAEFRTLDNVVVDEVAPITGETQYAKRRLACHHPLCHRCHGRAHRSRAHATKVIGGAEAKGARLYQLAVQVYAPYTRASLVETHTHTEKWLRALLAHEVWQRWAVGTSASMEITPTTVEDDGEATHFHIHIILQLPERAYGVIPTEVRHLIEGMGGFIGSGHSLVDAGTGTYFHGYTVKRHGKGRPSPFTGAKLSVIDGMLELVAARSTFHVFAGAWAMPSKEKKTTTQKVKKAKAKPTSAKEAVVQLASRSRVPVVVVDEQTAQTTPGVAVELVQVDTLGRRRRQLAWGIAPTTCVSADVSTEVTETNDDMENTAKRDAS